MNIDGHLPRGQRRVVCIATAAFTSEYIDHKRTVYVRCSYICHIIFHMQCFADPWMRLLARYCSYSPSNRISPLAALQRDEHKLFYVEDNLELI